MIERWVTEINPKAILRAADARCGARYAVYVVPSLAASPFRHSLKGDIILSYNFIFFMIINLQRQDITISNVHYLRSFLFQHKI